MVSMTIRSVSPETRDRLALRAARAGQSLQEYLHALVTESARRPDVREVIAEHRARLAAAGSAVTTESILTAIDETRR